MDVKPIIVPAAPGATPTGQAGMPPAAGTGAAMDAGNDPAEIYRLHYIEMIDHDHPGLEISDRHKRKLQRIRELVTRLRGGQ